MSAMTAATRIERSGPAVRAALAEFSPDECAVFETEFQEAAQRVGETFDLAPLDALLDRWWGIAAIRANPLSVEEQRQLDQAKSGEMGGLLAHDWHGWVRL
jgi:hypothetical protein